MHRILCALGFAVVFAPDTIAADSELSGRCNFDPVRDIYESVAHVESAFYLDIDVAKGRQLPGEHGTGTICFRVSGSVRNLDVLLQSRQATSEGARKVQPDRREWRDRPRETREGAVHLQIREGAAARATEGLAEARQPLCLTRQGLDVSRSDPPAKPVAGRTMQSPLLPDYAPNQTRRRHAANCSATSVAAGRLA